MRVHLSNTECAQFTHQQRLHSDVILTTAQTIKADNPLLNVRQEGQDATKKVIAILDRQLQLIGQELVLSHAKHCHIFYDKQLPITRTFAQCTYHAVPVIQGKLCLLSVCKVLGELGYHDVWVEAGGKLFSALHRAKLVDTTYVYLVPTVLGDKALSAYHDALIFEDKHRITWQAYSDNMVMRVDWLREKEC